eukprot:COSAG02_NODE_676_length_18610_cov_44.695532_20_plen_36_part_00
MGLPVVGATVPGQAPYRKVEIEKLVLSIRFGRVNP